MKFHEPLGFELYECSCMIFKSDKIVRIKLANEKVRLWSAFLFIIIEARNKKETENEIQKGINAFSWSSL